MITQIESSELETIENSGNPDISIHILVFELFKKHGYNKTQSIINETITICKSNDYSKSLQYLTERKINYEILLPYIDELITYSEVFSETKFEKWVLTLRANNFSKKKIYNILNEFFIYIQFSTSFLDNELVYNNLADFLDRFTDTYHGIKILSNESI